MIDPGLQRRLKERFYPQADENSYTVVNGTLDSYLVPGVRALDVGCGHGTWVLAPYRDKISRLVGVDVAPAEDRQILDDFVVADLAHIPLKDNSFDVVFCWDVVEHLARPKAAYSEFRRVLQDDGTLVVKTPSLLSPLMLASRLLPTFIHKKVKGRLLGLPEDDVYPTLYRSNTPGRLHADLAGAGFQCEMLTSFDQTYDYYLAFSRLTYALGLLYSRSLKSLPLGKRFMASIFGIYRKGKEERTEKESGRKRYVQTVG
ncbi:MAG: class I SAM-dependent methyltransferase [Dehalococcoidia bacterium]